jgi:hypothetical protein
MRQAMDWRRQHRHMHRQTMDAGKKVGDIHTVRFRLILGQSAAGVGNELPGQRRHRTTMRPSTPQPWTAKVSRSSSEDRLSESERARDVDRTSDEANADGSPMGSNCP